MSTLPCINHPRFTRHSLTEYTIDNPDHRGPWHVHVGQIMTYLTFDRALRLGLDITNLPGIPLGYDDFVSIFNSGTHSHDKRMLSTFIPGVSGKTDYVDKSPHPIHIQDFHITQEQCGLAPPRNTGLSEAQALIMEDYAMTQAYKNKRRHEQFQNRDSQWRSGSKSHTKKRGHRIDPFDDHEESVSDLPTAEPPPASSSTTNPPSTSNIALTTRTGKRSKTSNANSMQE